MSSCSSSAVRIAGSKYSGLTLRAPGRRRAAFRRVSARINRRLPAGGLLTGFDPDALAFTFWSTVHGSISLALRRRSPFPDEDPAIIATRAVEAMMSLIRVRR
ncbi:MAG: TetR-like C-terminal domain-containing protein [Thermomicrobiales bacterium]